MMITDDYRWDDNKDNKDDKTTKTTNSKEAVRSTILPHPDVWRRPATTTTTILRGFPFGRINIALVATSLTLCHLVTVYVRGRAYGWGRNEYYQLGSLSSSSSS